MKEALVYLFKDSKYKEKALFYYGICFLSLAMIAYPELSNLNNISQMQSIKVVEINPIFQILPIIGNLLILILAGYFFASVNAISNQRQNIILPFMNLGKSFIKGLKFIIAGVIFVISMMFVISALSLFLSTNCIRFFSLILILFFLFFINVFFYIFAKENDLLTFFDWKLAISLVCKNLKRYFKNWFFNILISFIGALISLAFTYIIDGIFNNVYIAWLLASLEGAFIATYVAFVSMYLVAKSIETNSVV